MIETWNSLSALWWDWMSQMVWQAGLVIAVVLAADRLLRRRAWPQLRLALWAVVMVKLLIPPIFSSPFGIPSPGSLWAEPSAHKAALGNGQAAANSVGAPVSGLSAKGGLMALWMSGSITLAAGLLRRQRRERQRIREGLSDRPVPDWLQQDAAWAADQLGLRRVPRLRLVTGLETAAAFGLLRPAVLLPASALDQVPRQDWRHVLLHEMAHIRRGDLWLHVVCQALTVFYWFYPLLYLVRMRIEQLRELCCDSLAASRSPAGAAGYRHTLLVFADRLLASPQQSRMPVSLLGREANILGRLEWLSGRSPRTGRRHQLAVAALAAFAAVVAVPMASPTADQSPMALSDPVEAQAWENLRQAAGGRNPGCLRLRYSALYLTLKQQQEELREASD